MSAKDQRDERAIQGPNCASIDLEVGRKDSKIYQFAAVLGKTGEAYVYKKGDLTQALEEMDAFCDSVVFTIGHNLIAFDLKHLRTAKSDLNILKLPAIDTLRLNPLAFPKNPYHHLVKHYQDGQLKRGRLNDPELDARLVLEVFEDQQEALRKADPTLLAAWHWLVTVDDSVSGVNAFFKTVRRRPRPGDEEIFRIVQQLVEGRACRTQVEKIVADAASYAWPLAYALAWLTVSGGNSVMPPWVRYQFPEAGELVRLLRDTPCDAPDCVWCRDRHDARKELKRWFGFDDFRPEPVDDQGEPLQRKIVEAAMRGEHVLAILPTGTGKSLCYQIPSLSRYEKTGALTVVISPLVALMADQVAGLESKGISSCAALNGLLSMPERADVLDKVRMGDIGILIVSPEQLRNKAFRNIVSQREIGAWVMDEAHCLSKWGHDFRPDYRYVGRFIREKAGNGPMPPVLCLTATAKPDVTMDILQHFRKELGIELKLFDGGANRSNLDFVVVPTSQGEKFDHIHQLVMDDLPPDVEGGAIVYCATRKKAEKVAAIMKEKGVAADFFHAGLSGERKKTVQSQFIDGELRLIAATNAFGMGIDKPDVRLVVHADIPGSLENYLQEAGRAGRDRGAARCVLMYTQEDVEKQFNLSARSRLEHHEIKSILRSLKRLDRKKKSDGTIVATAGEILAEEEDGSFERDTATDDTRVRTAISWLEEAQLLKREENQVSVFPSSLLVSSIDEAKDRLDKAKIQTEYKNKLLAIIESLIEAKADEGVSTDELMGLSSLNSEGIRRAMYDLEQLGIANNDTALTAYVHVGVEHSSRKRFEGAQLLETALIDKLREAGNDMDVGERSTLHLRIMSQKLKDDGYKKALPEVLWRIVRSIAGDGRTEKEGVGSLQLRRIDPETIDVKLQRNWSALEKTAELRRLAAGKLLEHLIDCLDKKARGLDQLSVTTLGKLTNVIDSDMMLNSEIKDSTKLMERALLWLHEQEVIRLNKGLAVFRPAMTVLLGKEKRDFIKADFMPLQMHYDQKVVQIHVMAEYATRGIERIADAINLAMDYFRLDSDEFLRRWMPGREKELRLQTTPESWVKIVDALGNKTQEAIVKDDRDATNVLVLAGPGSGKTRVLVHRIAFLIRVRRENPKGILALAYNRHAAIEIRRRLHELIGDDAKGISVMTCHAMAMRLVGASFQNRIKSDESDIFAKVMQDAISLLRGEGVPPEEADEQRERLLSGFRWILVDEYQDIGPDQYEMISAIAGKTLNDPDSKLSMFAVGDDDQNIYAFAGASVEYIRRFSQDYAARPAYLIDNYRSTVNIIEAANLVIDQANDRMKQDHEIEIDKKRSNDPRGGEWESYDSVAKGRVQILPPVGDIKMQAIAVMVELERLAQLDPKWDWTSTAVIAKQWKFLEPVRSYCELHDIPVQMADENLPSVWHLRESQKLIAWLGGRDSRLIRKCVIDQWLADQPEGKWWDLLREGLDEYGLEIGDAEVPVGHFSEWLADWGREIRRKQTGLLLLSAHRAKGLEFDHVVVIDGSWDELSNGEDKDAPRRLYYVAMTRARKTLTLAKLNEKHPFVDSGHKQPAILVRQPTQLPPAEKELGRKYMNLGIGDVYIGYAGQFVASHKVHKAITSLSTGDELDLKFMGSKWGLYEKGGVKVGQLAGGSKPPEGMRCVSAKVSAILTRKCEDEAEEYQKRVKTDCWEVVLAELVFE